MDCDKAASRIAALADGEVHGLERVWLEKHLRDCPSCTALHAEVLDLRLRLRSEAPYYAAPAGLRERVEAAVQAGARAGAQADPGADSVGHRIAWQRDAARMRRGWVGAALDGDRLRWLGGGALAGCAATLFAFVVGSAIVGYRTEHDIATQAVAAHVRATLGDRLIAVVSSDQHTVKPWLSARLDYSPPVRDLANEGFPLVGGRITSLDGRDTATLVYRYRKHTIDVYVRPEPREAPALAVLRGFNVAHMSVNGWDWLAVSDAEPDALERFLRDLVQAAASP